uniref:Hypoxia up-regulated protein 1 n=1 Tax=Globodera pallida TaxID=36090 RepID=A0A183C130_GLOPA
MDPASSAMAIDLGSEFMKMALIKPGVPMETVLNRESQRKTPMALTIKDGERFLGDAARKKGSTPSGQLRLSQLRLANSVWPTPSEPTPSWGQLRLGQLRLNH